MSKPRTLTETIARYITPRAYREKREFRAALLRNQRQAKRLQQEADAFVSRIAKAQA